MDKRSRRNVIRIIAIVLVIATAAGILLMIPGKAADTTSLLKLLDSYSTSSTNYSLTTSSRIYILTSSTPAGELKQTVQLAQRKFAAAGYPSTTVMPIYWGDETEIKTGDIVVSLDSAADVGAEGYVLTVGTTAKVSARDVDGLLYGMDMLLKHFRNANSSAGGAVTIKGFTASDTPDTPQRIVSLDCGRKYFTKNWICNYIREMSWMGYNTLEMHFSEDTGFRIDIWDSAYYTDGFQPKNDFTWIAGAIPTYWQWGGNDFVTADYMCDTYSSPSAYADMSKYLTASDLIEIFNVAKEYHIDIIPAFDSPAHVDYLTWRFYQYCTKTNTSYSFQSTVDNKTYKASDYSNMINYSTLANTKKYF